MINLFIKLIVTVFKEIVNSVVLFSDFSIVESYILFNVFFDVNNIKIKTALSKANAKQNVNIITFMEYS